MRHGASVFFLIVSSLFAIFFPSVAQSGKMTTPAGVAEQQTQLPLFNFRPTDKSHFAAKICNVSGLCSANSRDEILQVAGPETTTPNPLAILAVFGGVVMSAARLGDSASNSLGVAGVRLRIAVIDVGMENAQAPCELVLNTLLHLDGHMTLSTAVRDAAGNTAHAMHAISLEDPCNPVGNNCHVVHGSGWRAIDAITYSGAGLVQFAGGLNAITVERLRQGNGEGTGQNAKYERAANCSYAVEDDRNACYTGETGASSQSLLNVYEKDMEGLTISTTGSWRHRRSILPPKRNSSTPLPCGCLHSHVVRYDCLGGKNG
ncbi:MAG: hypothetical protein GTO51_05480 [Candidatus Latescibacteria bacterium]|nr:hypothetical protein [Candidatus Latescibacterota bacterium]NIO28455.1 hypothetical protein [Candidatus Latescibacterota bacterium]NIO56004.1 hypothetical protein [Candidatus Latescibacterota bacterium]NIT01968.1 hypothetical protein [Candidatus Latescibacterota bacterium]